MQSWNLSLSSSKQPWMMSARDLDWSSLKSRLQVRCGGELGFGSWNDSWLSSFCSWSSCWRSAPAELNAAKTVKMTHFNWDDMIYKLQTTGLSLIWTMKMYENVASPTPWTTEDLVQVAPSCSQPIALQINSPTCSGSRMSATTTKPCSPWWAAENSRDRPKGFMGVRPSEMWP